MSMSKKDFIALADVLKQLQPNLAVPAWASTPTAHANKDGMQAQWRATVDTLAEFCQQQNPHFMTDRWLDYIAGKCGKNGGTVK